MRVIIDLEKREDVSLKNIDINWNIQFPYRKRKFFGAILDVFRHVEKTVYVGIRDIVADKAIKCDIKQLFCIQYDTQLVKQCSLPLKIDLSQENTPFQLFVDTSKIFDCSESQGRERRTYHIKAVLYVENSDHETISKEKIDLEVEFLEINIVPSIKINLNKQLFQRDGIQYDSELGNVEIGKLRISYKSGYGYAPYIDTITNLQLYQDGVLLNNVLQSTNFERLKIRNSEYEEPLIVDFTKLKNPVKPSTFKIVNNSRYNLSCKPEVSIPFIDNNDGLFDEQKKFMLLPDPHGTELQFLYEYNKTTCVVTDGEETVLPLHKFMIQGNMGSRLNLVFNNLATDKSNPNAGVLLKHVVVSSEIRGAELVSARGGTLPVKDVIKVSGDNYEKLAGPSGYFIPNGKNSSISIAMDFMPSMIDDVKKTQSFEFQIISTLSFDYWENREGINHSCFEERKKSFKHTFVWNLYQKPNKEWLCVDYGTSAIVCMYENKIIDLREVKKNLMLRDAVYRSYTNDTFEGNGKFLSSDIILHDCSGNDNRVSSLSSEQNALTNYSKLAICLSPTSSLLDAFGRNQIPCLKLLIGHDVLPQANDYHDLNIPYYRMDESGNIAKVMADDSVEKEESNSILKIDNVFKEAYSALLRYFVKPSIENVERVNKLILTYPNTYTPVHINTLKGIVSQVLPSIRPGYLKFVGESDAVAAFYMKHWRDYHQESARMDYDENVLVYDMGAGTLDLTLFTKKYDSNSNTYHVQFLSKIGTTKAGNYLDSLIANILVENQMFDRNLVGLRRTAVDDDFEDMLALKNEVRRNKKLLSGDGTTILKFSVKKNDEKEISVSEILENQKFSNYLKEVTEGIVDNLLESCSLGENFRINTVIMSGRACKLKSIQKSLQAMVGTKRYLNEANVIILDEPVNCRISDESDMLKSSVCEGAVTYCNLFMDENSKVKIMGKRLYANYGITYKSLGGERHYVQLIGVGEIPHTDTTGTKMFENKTITDLSGADGLLLIQSYMTEEKTLRVLEAMDESASGLNVAGSDYISEMMKVDKEDYNNADSVDARLELDSDNNIILLINGNPSERNKPKGMNLESEITKMSLWPVPIC